MSTSIGIVAYLALFAGVGVVFLFVNLLVGRLVRPSDPHEEKLEIYECGEPPIGSSFVQFDLRFYVVALLFIIFDVEVVFMFPWAVVFQELGLLAFVEMFIFLAILLVGFAYVWVKGDLDWVKMKMKYAHGRYSKLSIKEEV